MRKFSGVTAPCGREARRICLLTTREAFEVMVGVAELAGDRGEAAEGVAHLDLVAHAHPAVQLHRFLADPARGVRDLDLRRGYEARALGGVDFPIHPRPGEACHGARLLA